jgi:hypothetical protein
MQVTGTLRDRKTGGDAVLDRHTVELSISPKEYS